MLFPDYAVFLLFLRLFGITFLDLRQILGGHRHLHGRSSRDRRRRSSTSVMRMKMEWAFPRTRLRLRYGIENPPNRVFRKHANCWRSSNSDSCGLRICCRDVRIARLYTCETARG